MKYLFLIMGFLCTLSGCEKVLDISPENSLTFKNAIETEKDAQAALDAAGYWLRNIVQNHYSSQEAKGEYADDFLNGAGIENFRGLSPEGIQPQTWVSSYTLIAQANVVIRFADDIKAPTERKEMYKGQGYFYKAIAYFELVRRFGDCILVKEEISLESKGKSPWTEVVDYAIEMAQKAVDRLPEFYEMRDFQNNTPTYRSTPCKGAANSLLAYLCAWKAGGKYFAADANYDEHALWQKAEQAASAVIGSGTYSLVANPEEVVVNVLAGDSRESIFETVLTDFPQEVGNHIAAPLAFYYQTYPTMPNSSPASIMSAYLRIRNQTVNTMYQNGDLRKYAYFYAFDEMSNPDNDNITGGFAYPYKWREIRVSTEGWNAGQVLGYDANLVWWRLSDIILLRAEARVRIGNETGAVEDLNTIRSRANADLYEKSEYNGDLRYAIFKEREKELLLEGHRYFDIIRNGYARTELEGGFRTATDQDFKDGAFFVPIESYQFVGNPKLRQNTYWFKFM